MTATTQGNYETQVSVWCKAIETSREKLTGEMCVLPSAEIVEKAIRGVLNTKTGTVRKTCPDGSMDDPGVLLWKYLKFHRSSGSLWGHPGMLARGDEKVLHDQIDTLATVMLVLSGSGSRAEANWRRAIHGS